MAVSMITHQNRTSYVIPSQERLKLYQAAYLLSSAQISIILDGVRSMGCRRWLFIIYFYCIVASLVEGRNRIEVRLRGIYRGAIMERSPKQSAHYLSITKYQNNSYYNTHMIWEDNCFLSSAFRNPLTNKPDKIRQWKSNTRPKADTSWDYFPR